MSKIFIASDHTGFALKQSLIPFLEGFHHEVTDMGASEFVPEDDYPDYIIPCATQVASTSGSYGIIIGGSGQGEAMAANRIKGVRACVYYGQAHATGAINAEGAHSLDGYDIVRLPRVHNNANVLSLAARFLSEEEAQAAIQVFLETTFPGTERHVRRIGKF